MENMVDDVFKCPKCGERNADSLVIDDDSNVDCCACGNQYEV